jgi:hypothetical protein
MPSMRTVVRKGVEKGPDGKPKFLISSEEERLVFDRDDAMRVARLAETLFWEAEAEAFEVLGVWAATKVGRGRAYNEDRRGLPCSRNT